MAVKAHRVTVETAVVELHSAGTDELKGSAILVRNRGATAVFIGGSAVTAAEGFELSPGESVPADLNTGEGIWGVCASGSTVVHVLEVGV